VIVSRFLFSRKFVALQLSSFAIQSAAEPTWQIMVESVDPDPLPTCAFENCCCATPNDDMKIAEASASSRGVLMQKPELLSRGAAEFACSSARRDVVPPLLDYLSRTIRFAALAYT
jgi:hypothetical protein